MERISDMEDKSRKIQDLCVYLFFLSLTAWKIKYTLSPHTSILKPLKCCSQAVWWQMGFLRADCKHMFFLISEYTCKPCYCAFKYWRKWALLQPIVVCLKRTNRTLLCQKALFSFLWCREDSVDLWCKATSLLVDMQRIWHVSWSCLWSFIRSNSDCSHQRGIEHPSICACSLSWSDLYQVCIRTFSPFCATGPRAVPSLPPSLMIPFQGMVSLEAAGPCLLRSQTTMKWS